MNGNVWKWSRAYEFAALDTLSIEYTLFQKNVSKKYFIDNNFVRFGDKLATGKRDSFIDSETESHKTGQYFSSVFLIW